MDQGGGLQGVVGPFASHVGLRESMQLLIDERQKGVGGGGVPGPHGVKQIRDLSVVRLDGDHPACVRSSCESYLSFFAEQQRSLARICAALRFREQGTSDCGNTEPLPRLRRDMV